MKNILFTTLALLTASWSVSTTMTGGEGTSATVQETIKQIKALNGVCTLNANNKIDAVNFIDGSALKDATFDLLAKQEDLESLQIANYRELNDANVANLTGLKKLKILKLANGGITDEAVKTIVAAFPNLTGLDLSSETQLTDAAAAEIAKLKNLESLSLLFCNISEFGIMDVAKLPKLKTLDIRALNVGNGGLTALAEIKTLQSLKHRSPSVTDDGIQTLTEFPNLSNLEIQDFNITGQAGQYFKAMPKLTSLIIFRCENFDSTGLVELKGLKLNRLTLRGLPVDDSGMEVFRELATLKKLYLDELPSVTDVGIMNLVYLKELETLEIWELPITDKALETIVKLSNLKTLILRSTDITDVGLETLLSVPSLKVVTLKDNAKVTPAAIQKLRMQRSSVSTDSNVEGECSNLIF